MAGMLRRDSLRQVALAGLGAAAAPGPPTTAPAGPPAAGEPGIGDVFEALTVPALDEPNALPFGRERRP
jgi:hypothetical protein